MIIQYTLQCFARRHALLPIKAMPPRLRRQISWPLRYADGYIELPLRVDAELELLRLRWLIQEARRKADGCYIAPH